MIVDTEASFYGFTDRGGTRLTDTATSRQRNRALSREIDFGVMWKAPTGDHGARLTWIESTGEVYVRWSGWPDRGGKVTAYAVVGTCRDEQELERRFEGWAEACLAREDAFKWARKRLTERFA
jgi:hypothetical protein